MEASTALLRAPLTAAFRIARHSAGALSALPGPGAGPAWRELANKLEAFERFEEGSGGACPGRFAGDPYTALWVQEGAGYRHAESGPAGPPPEVPIASRLPFHTGMGMAWAARLLGPRPLPAREVVDRFAARCRDGSAPGLAEVAFETLGLVARTLRPTWIPALDEELTGEPRELFWHGVGRGLYLAPSHALPWTSVRRALSEARRLPPDAVGLRNVLAGLGWAMTLVNVRHPEVVATMLAEIAPEAVRPWGSGAVGALLLWNVWSGPGALASWLGDGPGPAGRDGSWRRLIAEPVERARADLLPRLLEGEGWGDLFRDRTDRAGGTG